MHLTNDYQQSTNRIAQVTKWLCTKLLWFAPRAFNKAINMSSV